LRSQAPSERVEQAFQGEGFSISNATFTALRVALNHESSVCGWLPPFYSSGDRSIHEEGVK